MSFDNNMSDAERELESKAREIEAVASHLLGRAQSLAMSHFSDQAGDGPLVAAIFQGLVTLHGPIK